jgi:hypothetical protein
MRLKVLSSEMDPAEIGLIEVITERGAEVFRKNPPVPHPVSYSAILYSYWQICT